MMFTSKTK